MKKWGNSAAVRIPASMMESANIRLEDLIDISEKEGEIILKRVGSEEYDLINRITVRNLHEPIDFGPPEGKEHW